MKQIRRGVFETNSSSSHSLVIKKDGSHYTQEEMLESLWLDDDGTWEIWSEEELRFGRFPFRCLETFESKARYAIASFCGYTPENFDEVESVIKEIIPECTNIKLPKVYQYYDDSKLITYGGVDENILAPFLKENNISLKEFLTNKKYVVIVDGDEYCIWESLKNAGLINTDNIEKESK